MSEANPETFPDALRRKRVARDKAEGFDGIHLRGNCGYMASLCPDCEDDERAWMLGLYTAPAIKGETPIQYARRTNMRMLDTWYEVAARRCKEASR